MMRMSQGQRVETDPEKLREWQVALLIDYARKLLDEKAFPANTRDVRQSFTNRVAGQAVRLFSVTITKAESLAEEASKTVFAERGWTF